MSHSTLSEMAKHGVPSASWLPAALGPVREQYKKTWVGTQLLIAAITLAVLLQSHRLVAALGFFVTMQCGAIVGAMWAARLRAKIERARWTTPRA